MTVADTEKIAKWEIDENGVHRLMYDGQVVTPIKPEDIEETIQEKRK